MEGPTVVTFVNPNVTKTNVTGLTKGSYVFKVTVTDDNTNIASDNVYIIVNQSKYSLKIETSSLIVTYFYNFINLNIINLISDIT